MISIYTKEIKDLLSKNLLNEAEDIWLQLIEEDPLETELFISLSREFAKKNYEKQANTLLAMSLSHLIENDMYQEATAIMKRMAELLPHDQETVDKIVGYYRQILSDFPNLDTIFEVCHLGDTVFNLVDCIKELDILTAFKVNDFCKHNSWGIGLIRDIDFLSKNMTIDFYTKKNHRMDIGLAVNALMKIDVQNISAMKYKDINHLKELAETDPVELVKIVLRSFPDHQASLDDITHALALDIIGEKNWKKWWDKTKNLIKTDQYIVIPEKQKRSFKLMDKPVSIDTKVMKKYNDLHDIKDKLNFVSTKLKKQSQDMLSDEALDEIANDLSNTINNTIDAHSSLALETYYTLLSLAPQCEKAITKTEHTVESILKKSKSVSSAICGIDKNDYQRNALNDVKNVFPDTWPQVYLELLTMINLEAIDGIMDALLDNNDCEQEILNSLHVGYDLIGDAEDLLFWIAKNLWNKKYSSLLADFCDIILLEKLIDLMDLHHSGVIDSNERIVSKIKDYIFKNQVEFVVQLSKTSTTQNMLHVAKTVMECSSLDKMEKQTLIAKFILACPEVKELMKTEEVKSNVIYSSHEAFTKKQDELNHIMNVLIPQNAHNISIAREHGDLRENFEYKAAKEEQARLMRKKSELEAMLEKIRLIDLDHIDAKRVSIGTRVHLKDLITNNEKILSIMGVWDSDPDNGIISYLAPLSQSIIGKVAGDAVNFKSTDEEFHYQILKIEPVKNS
ncbi:MAG: GreA/GreB family elongation factor [Candidatus Auribacterota bacterium]